MTTSPTAMRERPAGAALAGDDGHDRRPQPAHQPRSSGRSPRRCRAPPIRRRDGRPGRRRRSRPAVRTARPAPSPASPCGSPPGAASRSCAGCSRRCRRPSAGRSTATRRPSSRARPATIAASSPNSRSPCSSTKSVGHRRPRSSRVRGRWRLRASWTRAQTASRGSAGPRRPSRRRLPRATAMRRAGPARRPCSTRELRNDSGRNARRARRRPAPERRPAAPREPGGAGAGRASSSRSAGRGTTRSMKPCANRNSERWKPTGSSWAIVPAETRDPANPISAFGSAMLTSPTAANEAKTPPVVGSDSTLRNGTPAFAQPLERGERLGQLHQGQRALLHPGAARGADDDQRHPLVERVLGGAGHLLADDRAHRAAHEPEVHDADRDRDAAERRRPPDRRVAHARSRSGPPAAGPGRPSGRRSRARRPTGGRRPARSRCPGRAAARAGRRPTAGSGGRSWGRPAAALSSCLLNSISSQVGHFVQRSAG